MAKTHYRSLQRKDCEREDIIDEEIILGADCDIYTDAGMKLGNTSITGAAIKGTEVIATSGHFNNIQGNNIATNHISAEYADINTLQTEGPVVHNGPVTMNGVLKSTRKSDFTGTVNLDGDVYFNGVLFNPFMTTISHDDYDTTDVSASIKIISVELNNDKVECLLQLNNEYSYNGTKSKLKIDWSIVLNSDATTDDSAAEEAPITKGIWAINDSNQMKCEYQTSTSDSTGAWQSASSYERPMTNYGIATFNKVSSDKISVFEKIRITVPNDYNFTTEELKPENFTIKAFTIGAKKTTTTVTSPTKLLTTSSTTVKWQNLSGTKTSTGGHLSEDYASSFNCWHNPKTGEESTSDDGEFYAYAGKNKYDIPMIVSAVKVLFKEPFEVTPVVIVTPQSQIPFVTTGYKQGLKKYPFGGGGASDANDYLTEKIDPKKGFYLIASRPYMGSSSAKAVKTGMGCTWVAINPAASTVLSPETIEIVDDENE